MNDRDHVDGGRRAPWKEIATALSALTLASCGSSPTVPGPTPVPFTGAASGVIARTQDGTPIAGATVTAGDLSTTTDALGRFALTGLQGLGPVQFTIEGPQYVTRKLHVLLGEPRSGLEIDVIPNTLPFLPVFYRELVRDGLERPFALQPLRRWTVRPSFYFKTSTEPSGRPVPPEVIDRIATLFTNSVRELSGGHLEIDRIETGSEVRLPAAGWVHVLFQQVLPSPNAAGQATVGGNTGTIWLRFDPDDPQLFDSDHYSGCHARVVQVAAHEIRHTMGYWHTRIELDPFLHDPGCDGADLSAQLRYHAAVAYSRPVGNRDPDTDPGSAQLATTGAGPPLLSCAVR